MGNGTIFVTADPHFDHANIIRHCNRPYSDLYDMNENLVHNWNQKVGKHDTVIVIGDFAYKNHSKWVMRLNGSIVLVTGNHDKMNKIALRDFSSVHQHLYKTIDGQKAFFHHFPCDSWWGSSAPVPSWHFFGHCHGRKDARWDLLRIDMGIDVWNYAPVRWDIIVKRMQIKMEIRERIRAERGDPPFIDRAEITRNENLAFLKEIGEL